ncbi:MAG: hypothetical protein PUD51_04390, partial [Prevotellaceae bacterium]|nr:hypothetical protein [Prevotellaceae bacterium]
YWATFSNKGSHAELSAPADNVTVYNATVSNGKMILSERSDNRVAAGEGVLLKAYCEYVNAKNISEPVTAAATVDNDLLPTPTEAGVISEAGYKYYRLTYNDVATKDKLGFYLGVVGESKDGSQLKATPGKAYLMLSSSNENAKVRGFILPGDDGETTGVECITVADEASHTDVIFDLQGRKLSKPAKGMYIKNNRVVFKLKN